MKAERTNHPGAAGAPHPPTLAPHRASRTGAADRDFLPSLVFKGVTEGRIPDTFVSYPQPATSGQLPDCQRVQLLNEPWPAGTPPQSSAVPPPAPRRQRPSAPQLPPSACLRPSLGAPQLRQKPQP